MPTYQTITIGGGQSAYIPKNAIIIGIDSVGDGAAESDCIDLDNVQAFACYKFVWSFSADRTPSVTLESQDTKIMGLKVGSVFYDANGGDGIAVDGNLLQQFLTDNNLQSIIKYQLLSSHSVGDRYERTLYVKTVASVADTLEMRIDGPAYSEGLFVKAASADGECPSDQSN